jgi:hypothetical protein
LSKYKGLKMPFHIVDSWDWSGAGNVNQLHHGIARARWENNAYTLAHRFSRISVIQELQAHVTAFENGRHALVGFDFPFSFPFAANGYHFVDNSVDWWSFSNTVFQTLNPCGVAGHFYGHPQDYGDGGFADHFAHLYLGAQHVGPAYVADCYRQTESLARHAGAPAASVFRLIRPMVGVQSLAGIFVLRSVLNWCKEQHHPLTLWPLGRLDRAGIWQVGTDGWNWLDHGVVIVETYPALSFVRAGYPAPPANWVGAQQIAHAMLQLGLIPGTVANHVAPANNDERDALVAMLHLLSPGWYRAQVQPNEPPGAIHLEGVAGNAPQPENVVGIGTPAPLRFAEGNIFGT